ncbi:MAG: ATP-binding protein [Clostridia bacterium]
MKIAVLSGKGGTGKTLVSVNLAAAAGKAVYTDCDVEEPNGHLFFKPAITEEKEINVPVPRVDKNLCNGCRKCVDFCNFNALAYVKDGLLIFDDICHSCGGCVSICPEKALHEEDRNIGVLKIGTSEETIIATGIMNTGESSGIPIIKGLLSLDHPKDFIEFIDCPPGSSCAVMESIREADYCLMVVEPTLFGTHNFMMVHELAALFQKPHSVIMNKYSVHYMPVEEYCKNNNIPVLVRIPYDPLLGILNSNGLIAVRENAAYRDFFVDLLDRVLKEVRHEAASHS